MVAAETLIEDWAPGVETLVEGWSPGVETLVVGWSPGVETLVVGWSPGVETLVEGWSPGHGGGCRYLVKHYPGFVNNLLHFLSHSSNKLDSMTGEVGTLEKAGGHVKEVAICFPLDKELIILIKT